MSEEVQTLRARVAELEAAAPGSGDAAAPAQLSGLLEAMADLVFVFDTQHRFVFCNATDSGDQRLLLPPSAFLGKRHDEVLPPDVDALFCDAFDRALHGETSSFDYGLTLGGQDRWYAATVSQLRDAGGVAGTIALVRDITERHEAETAVRDAEKRWRSLVENTTDNIMLIDRHGIVLYINQAAPGLDKDAVIGTSVYNYVPANCVASLREAYDRAFETGQPGTYETDYIRRNGETRRYEGCIGPIMQDGNVVALTVSCRDISDIRALEKALVESAERQRRELAFNLHDDLGQHLAGLQMISAALCRTVERDCPQALGLATQARELASAAVRKTRALAMGASALPPGPEGLALRLRQLAIDIGGRPAGPRVRFDETGPVAVGNVDVATHLYRIAEEAVNNAVRHADASEIVIRLVSDAEHIYLDVIDDGRGWTDAGTTGMGQRIMRFRAAMVGGSVSVDTAPGRGSRVSCTCPAPAST